MKSIMHEKGGTCYLCERLEGNPFPQLSLQEHHVVFGGFGSGRKLSEKFGLKVYLCLRHHTAGKDSVHQNQEIREMLCLDAQLQFEAKYPDLSFTEIFGKNYKPLDYSVREEKQTTEKGIVFFDADDE